MDANFPIDAGLKCDDVAREKIRVSAVDWSGGATAV